LSDGYAATYFNHKISKTNCLKLWRRSKQYLRENWGAPFVVAFILLLISSAALLSLGNSNSANNVAVYAFYALVLGVVLQIASYIKYGEGNKQTPKTNIPTTVDAQRKWRPTKKVLAIVLVLIILAAATAGGLYYKQTPTGGSSSASNSHTTVKSFKAGLNFIQEQPISNNAVEILVGINQTGGVGPFNFTAYWSDGVNQTNSVGVFTRSFLSNQTIPSNVEVQVNSSDGQSTSILVPIPALNRTTTLRTS
jgi:hypothetical protein